MKILYIIQITEYKHIYIYNPSIVICYTEATESLIHLFIL